jgi:biopolymer transport protein ExbB/TolQ
MSHDVYQAIFTISEHLELPVILAALAALVVVIAEVGAFVAESVRRVRRKLPSLTEAAETARSQIAIHDRTAAIAALAAVGWSPPMATALETFALTAGTPDAEPRIAKELADFDYGRERRLVRTRMLVRIGPALGLMGTLIPLSPALEGLSAGNTVRSHSDCPWSAIGSMARTTPIWSTSPQS